MYLVMTNKSFHFSPLYFFGYQAINFKPSMFTSCYICQKLCMMLALCGQTLVFRLKTTMVTSETCFMERRTWMARCVRFSISDNEDQGSTLSFQPTSLVENCHWQNFTAKNSTFKCRKELNLSHPIVSIVSVCLSSCLSNISFNITTCPVTH